MQSISDWQNFTEFIRHCFSCPLDDNAEIDFERECVGYREPGCKECILKHIEI